MMPFGPAKMPSLGLSSLAQTLRDRGISVRVEYPIVDFLRMLGEKDFDQISITNGRILLAEWIFSRFVDPIGSVDDLIAMDGATGSKRAEELRRLVDKAVPRAAELIETYARRIVEMRPRVVGFNSSFQQQMAGIALAKRLRELAPGIKIVIGGANCSAPMGEQTFLSYPVIDAVVVGPGEISFPKLVRAIIDGTTDIRLPGVYWRASADETWPVKDPGMAPEPPMDELPYPYYDDFFAIWPPESAVPPFVPLEGSRGCWWGQKQHCVFCSLNHSINYRAKSPERLYEEILHLNDRYPGLQLFAMDDILDLRVIGTITDKLAALRVRPRLYYSLKSNMRKEQLLALARAGVNAIQPGVESLADEVLLQMRKGVTGLRNIQLLKWAKELGIRVNWSILYGFPFDRAEYYERQARWLPSLTHLPAPRALTDVRIQRYSPLYAQAEQFGVTNLRPRKFYSLIYKLSQAEIDQLAYSFDWDPPEGQSSYIDPLKREVYRWATAFRSGAAVLSYVDQGDGLVVEDTRPDAVRPVHELGTVERAICLACDQVMKRHQIVSILGKAGHDLSPDVVDAILARLVADRLLLEHDDFFLFLATAPRDSLWPAADVLQQPAAVPA